MSDAGVICSARRGTEGAADLRQGIREHLDQFSPVFATGLTIGSERAVAPVLGHRMADGDPRVLEPARTQAA